MSAQTVEFVGGPLDGYAYSFSHRPEQLPPLAMFSISTDLVRVLIGQKRKVTDRATSTVLYCLDRKHDGWRYSHAATVPVGQPLLDSA